MKDTLTRDELFSALVEVANAFKQWGFEVGLSADDFNFLRDKALNGRVRAQADGILVLNYEGKYLFLFRSPRAPNGLVLVLDQKTRDRVKRRVRIYGKDPVKAARVKKEKPTRFERDFDL